MLTQFESCLESKQKGKKFSCPCFRFWSTDDNTHKQLCCPQQIKLESYLNLVVLFMTESSVTALLQGAGAGERVGWL